MYEKKCNFKLGLHVLERKIETVSVIVIRNEYVFKIVFETILLAKICKKLCFIKIILLFRNI